MNVRGEHTQSGTMGWRRQGARVVVALLLLAGLADLSAQTRREVRLALDRYSDEDEGKEQLLEWGDAALPLLEAFLDNRDSMRSMYAQFAITNLKTPAATEVMLGAVERVRGSATFTPDQIDRLAEFAPVGFLEELADPIPGTLFRELVRRAVDPATRPLVEGERYRAVMLGVADRRPGSPDIQAGVARVIACMGWGEELPRLTALLEHEDLGLRGTAAEALALLTGEPVDVDLPLASFPAEALDDGLVEHVGTIGYSGLDAFAFGPWKGAHRLVTPGNFKSIEVRDEALELVQRTVIDDFVVGVVPAPTPDGGQQFLCALSEDGPAIPGDYLAGLDEGGHERWRRSLDGESLETIAPLYRGGVVAGLLVETEDDDDTTTFAALDLEGEVLWSHSVESEPVYDVVPRLFSHPASGGLVSIVGNDWYWHLDAQGEPPALPVRSVVGAFLLGFGEGFARATAPPSAPYLLTRAIPLPKADDRPAMLLAGTALADGRPLLRREDIESVSTWEATLPSPAVGLCLVEPASAGGPWLVVVATLGGEFFVVQDDGKLVFRGRFEETRLAHGADDSEVMCSSMMGGRLGEHRAFAISAGDLNVYRLR